MTERKAEYTRDSVQDFQLIVAKGENLNDGIGLKRLEHPACYSRDPANFPFQCLCTGLEEQDTNELNAIGDC